MKVKNKVITALLMLACIFSLTACNKVEEPSAVTKSNIAKAESNTDIVLSIMPMMTGDANFVAEVNEYNNIELGKIFESQIYYMTQGQVSIEVEGKAIRNAITSFTSANDTVGAISNLNDKKTVVKGDTIIVTVPVECENGTGEIELIFSNDLFCKMQSCTFNVSQTMGDLMTKAGLNTLIGMGTVFIVLILISIIISCFAIIPKIQGLFDKKKEAPSTKEVEKAPVIVEEEEYADDTELVAVIAAAIAAYEGTSTDGFVVRSIKRSKTSKWNRA